MTTITAQIIADSISRDDGIRLMTMQLKYPRFIHSEFMTHRVFSRNASSSRAIPVAKQIDAILEDTAMPVHWGKNQKGMQADEECNEPITLYYPNHAIMDNDTHIAHDCSPEGAWMKARDNAIEVARAFDKAGYHKQVVNRILEPFSHINVVVTATDWSNFFALRLDVGADPTMRCLAEVMQKTMDQSIPEILNREDWHLPYIRREEKEKSDIDILIKCSVARCARVSYLTHEFKTPNMEEDFRLYDQLLSKHPLHASPAEHQGTPDEWLTNEDDPWDVPYWRKNYLHGNFKGWIQYRKTLKENVSDMGEIHVGTVSR